MIRLGYQQWLGSEVRLRTDRFLGGRKGNTLRIGSYQYLVYPFNTLSWNDRNSIPYMPGIGRHCALRTPRLPYRSRYCFICPYQGAAGDCRLLLVCEACWDGCQVDQSTATVTSNAIPSCRAIPVGVSTMPTTTLETFDLLPGYFRVSAHSRDVRECYRKESCAGGDNALNYCATGYTGPCK